MDGAWEHYAKWNKSEKDKNLHVEYENIKALFS